MNELTERVLCETRYMRVTVRQAPNGDQYVVATPAPAVVVLPYRRNDDGAYEIALLNQFRPEVDEWLMKAVGGYLNADEVEESCALRNLRTKLGIEATSLSSVGLASGYTVVPMHMRCFVTEAWTEAAETPEGCRLKMIPLNQAVELLQSGRLETDDATRILILGLFAKLALAG